MKKTAFSSLLLLMLLTFLSGCSTFVKQPVVTVKSVDVVSLDGGGAGMELYLTVKNTNRYDIKLLGYSYDLKVMAVPLAKGGAREEISFPAGVETDVRIPVRVSYADLLELLKRKINPDSVPYQLKAGLDLDTPVGNMNVPVEKRGTYAIPKQFRPSTYLNMLTDLFGLGKK